MHPISMKRSLLFSRLAFSVFFVFMTIDFNVFDFVGSVGAKLQPYNPRNQIFRRVKSLSTMM
jgi:hypothetical protein